MLKQVNGFRIIYLVNITLRTEKISVIYNTLMGYDYKLDFKIFLSFSAIKEAGEEDEVTRAKYFIRDEFLVSIHCGAKNHTLEYHSYSYIIAI